MCSTTISCKEGRKEGMALWKRATSIYEEEHYARTYEEEKKKELASD